MTASTATAPPPPTPAGGGLCCDCSTTAYAAGSPRSSSTMIFGVVVRVRGRVLVLLVAVGLVGVVVKRQQAPSSSDSGWCGGWPRSGRGARRSSA
eukprot:687620-Rhodomonas_salina.1